jgi:CRP-like cAMP-binding protein
LVSLSQRSDGPKGPAGEESSSSPFRNDARGAFEKASDVSQRVSSLRVAERSIARASSLAKLVDEKRDACPSSHREDASAETENALPPSPVRVAKGETFFQREEDPKVSFQENGEDASPFGSRGKTLGSDETRTNDDEASPASPWFSAARAVGTHALFLEPRLVEKNSSRDRTWDALVLSGIDAARLAEQRGGHGDAEATLRRSKTSPFAASARRENARRHDRGRVVTCREFTDCEKKRLLRNAQRASPYWRACRSDAELLTFAEAFEFVRYARGEHIVRAGDVADFALLVVEGEARLDKACSRDPFGIPPRAEDRRTTAFGPGTVLGEMALFLGGRRAASVVACGSEKIYRVGGDSESDDDVESDEQSEAPDGAADAAEGEKKVVPEDALAKKKKTKETATPHTYAVRVYFDAFVDFFAAHPVLATRALGAFANAAAGRLDRWRLANAGESPEKKVSGSGGRKDDVARRRNAREKKKRLREGLRGFSFARAWSEDDLEAVASVARVIDAKPGRPVFPAGASASDFGVLLAGSSFCSDEDGEDARMTFRAPDTSNTNRESKQTTFGTNVHSFTASAGSMVGAVAFAAALFRPAARPTSVLAGARGASVAVFDAVALETLDAARPGLGLDLALAAARAAATRRPSLDASDGRDDEDASTSLREEEEECVSANAFVPSAPEAEVCFPPDARPRRERGRKRNVTRFAEKRTRESDLLRMSASGGFPDEDETRCVSRRYERERRRVERALRAAFSAAGATEGSDLSRVSSRELVFLAASCSTLRFETGQQILRPGDRAAFAGVLVSGAATVVDAEGHVSSSFGAGSVIGESGAFGEAEHHTYHTYRRDAVVGGEDDTVVAVWTPEALRSMCVSDGTTKANANATPETPETPETPAVAARAARMFVFLCASTAARRAAANAARARRRESFVSTLEFLSDGEEASYASDASSSASDAPRYSSAPHSARSVKARGDEPYDPGARTSENDEDVRRLRATLWEWRDALADGAGACDVDALAAAMLDGSHEKPQNDDRRAARLVVSFAPGARVMAAGTVSSATLLVIGGAVDVDVGVAAKNDPFTKKETRAKKTFSTRGLGRFAGERAYFERCAPGAEDAFVHASSRAFDTNFYAVRPHDAFADERLGCSVIVFEHDALDRLASNAPGTALAMFARMAANAVDAFP